MSKGKGQKIAIKFDKPLLGDVTGNESAFTVTGLQRDPLKTGELMPKTFQVEKVERYPDGGIGDINHLSSNTAELGEAITGSEYSDIEVINGVPTLKAYWNYRLEELI